MNPGVSTLAILAAVAVAAGCGDTSPESEEAATDAPAAATATRVAPSTDAPATVPATEVASPAKGAETVAVQSDPTVVGIEPIVGGRVRRCPGDAPPNASCSWVEVPADWDRPDGEVVTLPVTVLSAHADERPDPVVALAGGLGFGASENYGWAQSPFNANRDVVLYDQRGTGRATPSLDCPEVDDAQVRNLQRTADHQEEVADLVAAHDICRERLIDAGIDLDDYDTDANVRDLDAIRTVLGYDEWNLLGYDYGGRLALAAMRSTPAGIRSVVLDSARDVTHGGLERTMHNAERGLWELADACAADPACARTHGDLDLAIDEIHQRYEAAPMELSVDLGDGPEEFVLTGTDVLAGLYNGLYEHSLIPFLPYFTTALADGDTALADQLIRVGVPDLVDLSEGAATSVSCADEAGLGLVDDAQRRAEPGRYALLSADVLCAEWPVPPTSPRFNEPVVSDIPTLSFSGRFVPIAPPTPEDPSTSNLTHATFVQIPDAGHRVIGPHAAECAAPLAVEFFEHPGRRVDAGCVDRIAPFEFVLS